MQKFKVGDTVRLIPIYDNETVYLVISPYTFEDGEVGYSIEGEGKRAIAQEETLVLFND